MNTEEPIETQPAPIPEPESSRSEMVLAKINDQIAPLQKLAEWIQNHRLLIDAAPADISMCSQYLDMDRLSHEQVVEVIHLFGGTWKKSVNADQESVDYVATIDGQEIRCWAGKPPPSCQIVEVEVDMPAIPAHKQKVRKLVCSDASQSV